MTLKEGLELIPGIMALGGILVAILKYGKSIKEYASDISQLPTRIKKIELEIKPNGGSSLKDAVNRIDNRTLLNEQQLNHILNDYYQGTFKTDADGLYTQVSTGYTHLTGKTIEECMGNNWISNVHPTDRQKVADEWGNAIKYKRNFHCKLRILNGEKIISVCCDATPLVDRYKNVTSWFGVVKECSCPAPKFDTCTL